MVTTPRPATGLVDRARLFALLDQGVAGRVTLLSAPAGSGKTTLLTSWLKAAEPPGPVAWLGVERDETDAGRFWGAVVDALGLSGAVAPGDPLATLAPAPLGGQEELLTRLLEGLGRLAGPVVLVLDDLQHLRSDVALSGLERVLERAPAQLRTVLVTRRDPKLGLHRLRLAGELTEIRAADLEFSADEARELFAGAGVDVAGEDVARLQRRTEGWAAGLRLAALSLSRHEAPDRFVAEFSGSERTVADYLLGEVLAHQPEDVRRLLLRTCILERVTGPLADLLTGRDDGARLLAELEQANAFVVAADVGRTWFRYHHLLADLLRLELAREAPGETAGLHRLAAGWYADNGLAIDAIRHAQLGGDVDLAAELLGRHWVRLVLDGEEGTLRALLTGLPPDLIESDAELAAIVAIGRMAESRWGEADALLEAARRALPGVTDARRHRVETTIGTAKLFRGRRLGDLDSVVAGVSGMLDGDGASPELQALALMNLGIAEGWTLRLADSEAHLRQGLALGKRIGSAYVEVGCLSALGVVSLLTDRLGRAEELLRQSIAISERIGWMTHPQAAVAFMNLASVLIDRGHLAEGEQWLERADPVVAESAEPAAIVGLRHVQGMLAVARGRFEDALASFREAVRLTEQLRAPHFLALVAQQWVLRVSLRLGDAEAARTALEQARAAGMAGAAQWCSLGALLALDAGDPAGAAEAVAPAVAGEAFAFHPNQEIEALLLDGLARLRLEQAEAAQESAERALARAEPDGRVWIVLTIPGVRELLEAHPRHRTAHAAHLRELLDHLAGSEPAARPADLQEPLSERELAVLRFLPTNLSASQIGGELYLSVHTVKTHMRKLYAKLDVHTRAEAVQCARSLGLLAPARRG
jgi:LuxR family maltose regulon positive regulatory protein